MSLNYSQQLAAFAVNLNFEDIPPEVVRSQKDHLLDGLGNGLYGATTELGRQILQVVDSLPSSGSSSIWGTGKRVSCQQAAFANGTFANIAELEDGHTLTKLKPNSCLVPAAIAVAERLGSSGRELLVALIAGLEVSLRISEATHVGKEGYARGWIATSSMGQFGAAVAAGRLMGFDVNRMVEALSLAGMQPCGIWSTGLSTAKRVAIGRAAENGVFAAFMATNGIAGGDQVFDGEWGSIGNIISPVFERDLLTKGLGETWQTLTVALKCYPTKGGAHSSIDGILDIVRREPGLKAEDVREIIIRTTTGVAKNKALSTFPPRDYWEAQNSLPYLVARAFISGKLGLTELEEAAIRAKEALALGAKVRIEPSEEADRLPPQAKTAFIDVVLTNGRVISSRVEYCTGEPQKPLTAAQLHAKFRDVAKYVLDDAAMTRTIGHVDTLEKLDDVRKLSANLMQPSMHAAPRASAPVA